MNQKDSSLNIKYKNIIFCFKKPIVYKKIGCTIVMHPI